MNQVVPDFQNLGSPETAEALDQAVPHHILWNIRNSAHEFETVFAAELETIDTYYISQKGIYSTNLLIEKSEMAFTDEVRSEFKEQMIDDIRQAGKCLAFDLDTRPGSTSFAQPKG